MTVTDLVGREIGTPHKIITKETDHGMTMKEIDPTVETDHRITMIEIDCMTGINHTKEIDHT